MTASRLLQPGLCALILLNGALAWSGWPAIGGDAARAGALLLAYTAFCGLIFYRHRRRLQRRVAVHAGLWAGDVLIVFASQTGFAEELALHTGRSLQSAGTPARVLPIAELGEQALTSGGRMLFIVSTTGEGDPPDDAAGFVRRVMSESLPLDRVAYGVMALGDSSYRQFCAFGRALDGWLRHHQAVPLFDRVEVDDGDAGALRHWQHHVGLLGGHTDLADWERPGYGRWRLVERRHLNPGSPGDPAFHLSLTPIEGKLAWTAGDIAVIGPRNDPAMVRDLLDRLGLDGGVEVRGEDGVLELAEALADRQLPVGEAAIGALLDLPPQALFDTLSPLPHREYSVASVPEDGCVDLLVRRMRHPDGGLGSGSGWLTAHAPLNGEIALRVRTNRSFHPPPGDRPLILIGNGTGLAGLRAHLKARALAGYRRNWLLFGERSRAHDFFHAEEIRQWQGTSLLTRLDLAFSRDQAEKIYVQDLLHAAAGEVRHWVADGAAIYVCGSLNGMAGGVADALTAILGAERLEALTEEGRYRRDVY